MKLYKLFIVLVASAFAFASCVEKAPEYEPASPMPDQLVYFDPASRVITKTLVQRFENPVEEKDTIQLVVYRRDTTGTLTCQITSEASTRDFVIDDEITFEEGENATVINVVYPDSLAVPTFAGPKDFTVTVDIAEYRTEYTECNCVLNLNVPKKANWVPIETEARIQNDFLGVAFNTPVYEYDVYVEKLEGKNVWRVANIFTTYTDEKTGKVYTNSGYGEGDDFDPSEVVDPDKTVWTYFDAEGYFLDEEELETFPQNGVFIPITTSNIAWSYGEMKYGSAAYNLRTSSGPITPKEYAIGKFDFDKQSLSAGNTGLYLPTNGWYVKATKTVLFLDKTLMYTDYNSANFNWTPVLENYYGQSEMLADSAEEPAELDGLTIAQDAKDSSLFCVADYFGKGNNLAFVAEVDTTGGANVLFPTSAVSDVVNYQKTGLYVLGHDILFTVKGGSFEIDTVTTSEVDTLNLTLKIQAYYEEEDGSKVVVGKFEEFIHPIYYAPKYTADDVTGISKAAYAYYKWKAYGEELDFDTMKFKEEASYAYVYISDTGTDEDGYEMTSTTGLSGFSASFWTDGTENVEAEWDNGFLYYYTQLINAFNYDGTAYQTIFYTLDSQTLAGGANQGTYRYLVAGMINDGSGVAYVDYPYNTAGPADGFWYRVNGLTNSIWRFVWLKPVGEAGSAASVDGATALDKKYITSGKVGKHKVAAKKAVVGTQSIAKPVKARTINVTSPVEVIAPTKVQISKDINGVPSSFSLAK